MNQNGFTLLEALIAVSMLGIVLTGIAPAFLTYLDSNTLTEQRTGAVAAAQQTMESLRQADPTTLPSSGNSNLEIVTVGSHDFEVITRYCTIPAYCSSASRHLVVEVGFGGRTVYSVETIFTALR